MSKLAPLKITDMEVLPMAHSHMQAVGSCDSHMHEPVNKSPMNAGSQALPNQGSSFSQFQLFIYACSSSIIA